MLIILYLITIVLAFFSWFLFLLFSKFRANCKNRFLITIISWLAAFYILTIGWTPLFIARKLGGESVGYNDFLGFFIFIFIFSISFYIDRKRLIREIKEWNNPYGGEKILPSCSSEKESPKAMLTSPIDNILVEKAKRQMHLRNGENVVKTYRISLGKNPVGAKVNSGDNKTPEGNYTIEKHNPKSKFHLSLKISYPNAEQINAAKVGNYEPGGDIMIHGYPNKVPAFLFKFWHRWKDWTAGCIAVTNDEIEEIYDAVKDGTPITIKP